MKEYLDSQGGSSKQAEGSQTDQQQTQTDQQQTQPAAGNRKVIKITDDLGDEIQEELDLDNEDSLREIVAAKHKLTHALSELELTKAQLDALGKAGSERDGKIGKLLAAMEMGDEAALDVLLEARGGFKKVLEEEIAARDTYAKMSAKEKEAYDTAMREKELTEKQKKMMAELEAKEKSIKDRELAAQNEAELLLYRSAASKYCPPVNDNKDLHKVHNLIFEEAKSELVKLKKSGVKLTTAIVDQKFAQAYKNNKSLLSALKPANSSAGNTIAQATNAAMGGAATQTASSHSTTVSLDELEAKWDNLLKEGKAVALMQESARHPELFDKYFQKKTGKKY
jgi:hypothetical protein